MLRQTSSRNHRSRGLKLKKALQISILVLVSVWLLYQVKHSHDKKRAYAESESNDLHKDQQSQGEMVRLGRKDLPQKMEADSSTLDERIEDEENEEMEQEMKHDDNDDDPIDEADLEKDEDPAEKDGGLDDVGVFEDEEPKERSQEDQEKSFHGDNVSSAVVHEPPATEHEEVTRQAREKSFHGDNVSSAVVHEPPATEHEEVTDQAREKSFHGDDVSSAVSHDNQEAEHKEEESHKARAKSFRGDDVSPSVDHDAQVMNPLPEEQLNSMDSIFEGTTNLSNGITFKGPGVNGSNAAGEPGATSVNVPTNSNLSIATVSSENKVDLAAVDLTNNQSQLNTGSEHANSTSLTAEPGQEANSTAVLNNQKQLSTNLTTAFALSEMKSPPNGTSGSVFTDAQETTARADENDTSSIPLDNNVEGSDTHSELDPSSKIMNKAMSEKEVLLE